MRNYAPDSYDDYLCLKPPLLLWIVVLFLSRAISLPIAMAISSVAGISSDATRLIKGLWSPYTIFPSLIAAVVLYAMCRRHPSASRIVRSIWAYGRPLLVISAGIDVGLVALSQMRQAGDVDDQLLPSLCIAALDLYFMMYVLAARRVRDAFADFPPLVTTTQQRNSAG